MVLTYEESGILEEKNYKRRMQWSIKSGEAWVRLLCYKKENIGDPTLSLSLRWWSRLSEADPTHHRSRSQITSYISVINSIFNLESMTDPWKNLLWRQKRFFFFFYIRYVARRGTKFTLWLLASIYIQVKLILDERQIWLLPSSIQSL